MRIVVDITPPGPVVDTLFDGIVTLDPDTTFSVEPYQNLSAEYTVDSATPLGALNAASLAGSGFSYSVSDKSYAAKGILLLDEVGGGTGIIKPPAPHGSARSTALPLTTMEVPQPMDLTSKKFTTETRLTSISV